MVRVLHMISSLHTGGSQTFVLSLYDKIDKSRVQFDFVVFEEDSTEYYDAVETKGGKIFVCPKYTATNPTHFCKWWNEFFVNHPEYPIIHGHNRIASAIYLKIAKKHGLVTIAHSHSTSNGKGLVGIAKDAMRIVFLTVKIMFTPESTEGFDETKSAAINQKSKENDVTENV